MPYSVTKGLQKAVKVGAEFGVALLGTEGLKTIGLTGNEEAMTVLLLILAHFLRNYLKTKRGWTML